MLDPSDITVQSVPCHSGSAARQVLGLIERLRKTSELRESRGWLADGRPGEELNIDRGKSVP